MKFAMGKEEYGGWRLNKRVDLSFLVQLIFLATLIVGSWANLQSQLNLLQHDVGMVLQRQKDFEQKMESLSVKSISCDYRLRAIEKMFPDVGIDNQSH